jgi:uncharacterized protein (TIRG00374 family)
LDSRLVKRIKILSLILGIGLLVLALKRLDPGQVWLQIRQVGWYFALSFGMYVVRMLLSGLAWQLCIDPKVSRARFRHLVAASWAGHALNQLTPAASMGEVLKGTILWGLVDGEELIASIVANNFLSTVVAQYYNLIGPLLCLLVLDLPSEVVWTLFGVAVLFCLSIVPLYLVLRLGATGSLVRILSKLPLVKLRDPDALLRRAQQVDLRIRSFRRDRPKDFWKSILVTFLQRMLQAAEIFTILAALLPGRSLGFVAVLALLTHTTTQLITWAATFVPGQIGVSEGGTALIFRLLQLDPVVGFSLSLVRRIQWVIGITIGLLIGLGYQRLFGPAKSRSS